MVNDVASGFTRRIIILIQESRSKVLIERHTCLRLLRVKRSVNCCAKPSTLVWSLPSANLTWLAQITLSSGTIFTTRPAELDSEFYSSYFKTFLSGMLSLNTVLRQFFVILILVWQATVLVCYLKSRCLGFSLDACCLIVCNHIVVTTKFEVYVCFHL